MWSEIGDSFAPAGDLVATCIQPGTQPFDDHKQGELLGMVLSTLRASSYMTCR